MSNLTRPMAAESTSTVMVMLFSTTETSAVIVVAFVIQNLVLKARAKEEALWAYQQAMKDANTQAETLVVNEEVKISWEKINENINIKFMKKVGGLKLILHWGIFKKYPILYNIMQYVKLV